MGVMVSLRASVSDKTSIFHPKTCVAFRGKAKKTLSNNNIKCYYSLVNNYYYELVIVQLIELQIILQLENTVN